jgi:hypothetical protein
MEKNGTGKTGCESHRLLSGVRGPLNSGRLPASSPVTSSSACCIIPASGYRNNDDGALNDVGNNGNYWSSSVSGASNAYNLNFNSNEVNPANGNDNRANGQSVRCVQNLTPFRVPAGKIALPAGFFVVCR